MKKLIIFGIVIFMLYCGCICATPALQSSEIEGSWVGKIKDDRVY